MSLRRKVTGALAWVGLVIVVAVPAAELVSSRLVPMLTGGATANKLDVPAKPVATAPAAEPAPAAPIAVAPEAEAPAATPAVVASKPADKPGAASNDTALDEYLSSGRTLPDYLTPGKAKGNAARSSGAPTAEPPAVPATTTADLPPAPPAAPPPAKPTAAASTVLPPLEAGTPAEAAPAAETPAVASVPAVGPVPLPAKARPKPVAAPIVTEDDFRGWKSGSLEDYLKQQGLLSGEPAANN
jgi:hypothetical protein